MGAYDGVFFHTYPLNDDEYVDTVVKSATFAEHFFATVAGAPAARAACSPT